VTENPLQGRPSKIFRYRHLAAEIEKRILDGVYAPGERLPSIRRLHQQTKLSISTVYHAMVELEATGWVEARPRSGYYVRPVTLQALKAPDYPKNTVASRRVSLAPVINSVVEAISNPRFVPLGNTTADPALLPVKSMAQILKTLSRDRVRTLLAYSPSEGLAELKRQIALRTVGVVEAVAPEDIIVTNGCMEAISLSLLAVTRPGDTVAIEAPTNFSFLQLLKELGLRVAEIATDPRDGVDLEELEKSLRRNRIRACLFMPNFHNPLGALMPADKKRALVKMLAAYEIPLIEDDISGPLHFDEPGPEPLKTYDRKNLVLTCSSFSKTLAPGLRIGWVIPGRRFLDKIQRLKAGVTISTSTLDQHIVARFLAGGAYERHLRFLRTALKKQLLRTAVEIQRHFPEQTRLAIPRGGSLLWVQLPPGVDGLEVYHAAFDRDIAIIPGAVCSNSDLFANYIQITCAAPLTPAVQAAIRTLGAIVSEIYGGA